MVLKLPRAQKWMLWAFEKIIFQFFANIWVMKLKPFYGKVRQSAQNYLNQNLVIGSFLENGFEATLSSKINVVTVWKEHFSVFCKFLSDEVETIFCGSDTKRSKLFKSKFGHRKLLSVWKEHFSVFCKFLGHEVETIFWESEAKRSKLFKSKHGHRKLLSKRFWSYLELKSECCERLKRAFFSFLQIFGWRSWNHFMGKWGKVLKTI